MNRDKIKQALTGLVCDHINMIWKEAGSHPLTGAPTHIIDSCLDCGMMKEQPVVCNYQRCFNPAVKLETGVAGSPICEDCNINKHNWTPQTTLGDFHYG